MGRGLGGWLALPMGGAVLSGGGLRQGAGQPFSPEHQQPRAATPTATGQGEPVSLQFPVHQSGQTDRPYGLSLPLIFPVRLSAALPLCSAPLFQASPSLAHSLPASRARPRPGKALSCSPLRVFHPDGAPCTMTSAHAPPPQHSAWIPPPADASLTSGFALAPPTVLQSLPCAPHCLHRLVPVLVVCLVWLGCQLSLDSKLHEFGAFVSCLLYVFLT